MKKNVKKKAKREKPEKLYTWQDRLAQADRGFDPEVSKMDKREAIYNGDRTMQPLVDMDKGQKKKCYPCAEYRL